MYVAHIEAGFSNRKDLVKVLTCTEAAFGTTVSLRLAAFGRHDTLVVELTALTVYMLLRGLSQGLSLGVLGVRE